VPGTGDVRCWPAAGRVIQGISIQALQGPPEGGLRWHRTGDPERIPGGLVRVGGPFGDRRERPGAGQDCAQRQAQGHRQPVPHAPARPWIRDRGQRWQQPPALRIQGLHGGRQLANRRVNQG
jgi:hypothetical protein